MCNLFTESSRGAEMDLGYHSCIDRHHCGESQTADLPTRLLDLDSLNPNKIKLILTANLSPWTEDTERPRYAALSYCWGAQNIDTLRTTPSNLQQHLKAIRVSDLPRTLQQTIWVARDLGIRYLWIDALCILQREPWGWSTSDSEEEAHNKKADTDWQYESARMHLVYGNAFLTIVAASASHSKQGFRFRYTRHLGGQLSLHEDPISGRAWALQEWALSCRRLVFSKSGLHFVCARYGPLDSGIQMRSITVGRDDPCVGWHKLVRDYCSRDLTNPRDKLTALSGLAQTYAERLEFSGNDYLAGLWRHWLWRDLLWKRTNWPLSLNVPNNIGRQPGRAPTWTWASMDGNVEFFFDGAIPLPEAEIQNCQVELAVGDDVFGQVKSGTLDIKCPYIKASFCPPPCNQGRWWNGDDDGLFFSPDDETEFEGYDIVALHCLLLARATGLPRTAYIIYLGILVRFDDMQQRFVRVGAFKYQTSLQS